MILKREREELYILCLFCRGKRRSGGSRAFDSSVFAKKSYSRDLHVIYFSHARDRAFGLS